MTANQEANRIKLAIVVLILAPRFVFIKIQNKKEESSAPSTGAVAIYDGPQVTTEG